MMVWHTELCASQGSAIRFMQLSSRISASPTSDRVTKDTVAVVYAGNIQTGNAHKALVKNIPLVHVAQIDALLEELKAHAEDLENPRMEYSIYSMMKDIQRNCPVYVPETIE